MNLTEYVRQVSLEDFGRPFVHTACWNKRLRTTGGRFFPKDGHLDFNPKHYDSHGEAVFRQIVCHELCHYHLYFEGKGYCHRDRDFKDLLERVNGLRFAPTLPQKVILKQYRCQNCRSVFLRRRRIDTDRYSCGKCLGHLILERVNHSEP